MSGSDDFADMESDVRQLLRQAGADSTVVFAICYSGPGGHRQISMNVCGDPELREMLVRQLMVATGVEQVSVYNRMDGTEQSE